MLMIGVHRRISVEPLKGFAFDWHGDFGNKSRSFFLVDEGPFGRVGGIQQRTKRSLFTSTKRLNRGCINHRRGT